MYGRGRSHQGGAGAGGNTSSQNGDRGQDGRSGTIPAHLATSHAYVQNARDGMNIGRGSAVNTNGIRPGILAPTAGYQPGNPRGLVVESPPVRSQNSGQGQGMKDQPMFMKFQTPSQSGYRRVWEPRSQQQSQGHIRPQLRAQEPQSQPWRQQSPKQQSQIRQQHSGKQQQLQAGQALQGGRPRFPQQNWRQPSQQFQQPRAPFMPTQQVPLLPLPIQSQLQQQFRQSGPVQQLGPQIRMPFQHNPLLSSQNPFIAAAAVDQLMQSQLYELQQQIQYQQLFQQQFGPQQAPLLPLPVPLPMQQQPLIQHPLMQIPPTPWGPRGPFNIPHPFLQQQQQQKMASSANVQNRQQQRPVNPNQAKSSGNKVLLTAKRPSKGKKPDPAKEMSKLKISNEGKAVKTQVSLKIGTESSKSVPNTGKPGPSSAIAFNSDTVIVSEGGEQVKGTHAEIAVKTDLTGVQADIMDLKKAEDSGLKHAATTWYQTKDQIVFVIYIPDIKQYKVTVGDDKQSIQFRVDDPPGYGFDLSLFGKVQKDPAELFPGQQFRVKLNKVMKSTWPRLLLDDNLKLKWLKYDSDRIDLSEGDDEFEAWEKGKSNRYLPVDWENMDDSEDLSSDSDSSTEHTVESLESRNTHKNANELDYEAFLKSPVDLKNVVPE